MKRILLSVTLVLGIMASTLGQSVWDCTTKSAWTYGSGTSADPYLIENAEQLAYFAEQVNAGTSYSGTYFKLTCDIDWNGCVWYAIGSNSAPFSGHFDADNHYIHNVTYQLSANNPSVYGGFFGYITNGSVSNLYIASNCTFTAASSNTTYYLGAVAAYASGTKFTNCHNEAPISVSHPSVSTSFDTYVGGVVGYVASGDTMKQCSNKGNVSFNVNNNNT